MPDDDPLPDAAWFDELARCAEISGWGRWRGEFPDPWEHARRQRMKVLALRGRDMAQLVEDGRDESSPATHLDAMLFGTAIDAALERIANRTDVTEDADDGGERCWCGVDGGAVSALPGEEGAVAGALLQVPRGPDRQDPLPAGIAEPVDGVPALPDREGGPPAGPVLDVLLHAGREGHAPEHVEILLPGAERQRGDRPAA